MQTVWVLYHGRQQKFFQGGQSRRCAYLFQVVGDASKCYCKQLHTVFSLEENFALSKCLF